MRSTPRACVIRARCFPRLAGASSCLRVAAAPSAGEAGMTTADLEIDGVSAQRSVAPTSPEELAEAVGEADRGGQAVAPIGGGTQLELGMPPERLDLGIETTGVERGVEGEAAELT